MFEVSQPGLSAYTGWETSNTSTNARGEFYYVGWCCPEFIRLQYQDQEPRLVCSRPRGTAKPVHTCPGPLGAPPKKFEVAHRGFTIASFIRDILPRSNRAISYLYLSLQTRRINYGQRIRPCACGRGDEEKYNSGHKSCTKSYEGKEL